VSATLPFVVMTNNTYFEDSPIYILYIRGLLWMLSPHRAEQVFYFSDARSVSIDKIRHELVNLEADWGSRSQPTVKIQFLYAPT
jgi:hypothetical protein